MSRNHESGTNKTFVCGRDSEQMNVVQVAVVAVGPHYGKV